VGNSDRIRNRSVSGFFIRSLIDPPADLSLERRRQCLLWAQDVMRELRGANAWLEARFDEAAEQLARSLR
jgi:hypothetical protein